MKTLLNSLHYRTVPTARIVTQSRRRLPLTVVALIALSSLQYGCSAQKDAMTTAGGVHLFNGENLDGWTAYGTERWFVENGELVCESGPDEQYGYLATDQHYKDFELSVDFLQEANGNSGVFFRSTIEGTKITGWQAEVAPPGDNTGGIYESYGRGWLIQPPAGADSVLTMGDWNSLVVKVVGGRVQTWLNGQEMIDLQDDKIAAGEGSIALQIHDGGGIRVRWKNIILREL